MVDAPTRTKQNKRLQKEVASDLGVDAVTVKQAAAHRRKVKGVLDIVQRPIPLDDENLEPIGVVLGALDGFRTVSGKTAYVQVTTNALEFGHTILDAANVSHSELLVIALYKIPRNLGLPEEDTDETDD